MWLFTAPFGAFSWCRARRARMGGKYHARCGRGPYTGGSWFPGSMITQVLIEAKLVETFPSAIPGCPVHHPMRGNGSASAVSARLQRLGVYTAHGDKQFALDLDETTDAELASIGIDAVHAASLRSATNVRKARIQSQLPGKYDRQTRAFINRGTDVQRLLAHARLIPFHVGFQFLGVSVPADFADVTSQDLKALDMGVVQRRRFHLLLQSIAAHPPPVTDNFTISTTHMQDDVVGFLQHVARFSRRMIVGLDWDHGASSPSPSSAHAHAHAHAHAQTRAHPSPNSNLNQACRHLTSWPVWSRCCCVMSACWSCSGAALSVRFTLSGGILSLSVPPR